MNLHRLLQRRADDGNPVRVLLIGAGKFGSMYLAQARVTPGIHIAAIADLSPARAAESLRRTGWAEAMFGARSLADAVAQGTTFLTDDAMAMIAADGIDVVIDATGSPAAGIRHALACAQHGKHIVMVNVEADALAGPLLARRCEAAGVVYSLAYGDQPALICEMVDWARAAGFEVVAPARAPSTCPATTSRRPTRCGATTASRRRMVAAGDFNAQMFNSFLDGTKSAIEMAAVANATGLTPAATACLPALRRRRPAAHAAAAAPTAASSSTPARWRWSPASSATAARCSATCAGACM
jgi:predicted homoserine dehydrogenase-like protein